MNKWKEISYPSMFVDLADELAELRTFHSKHVYKEGTEKYRGDREHKISMLGILSELIARNYFEESELNIEVAKLVEANPIVGADIIIDELGTKYLIDVKGVKKDSKKLRINYKAHNNPRKKITHYLFIIPLTRSKAKMLWINYDQVSEWKETDSTYTKVYEKEISEINE